MIYSIEQLRNINFHVGELVDNLDEEALQYIYSGTDGDIDKFINGIYKEVANAIYSAEGTSSIKNYKYFEMLGNNLEENLRCVSFNYFIGSVLPDFYMNWHHLEWGSLVQIYKWLCVIAARDHGKSFFFSYAYILWKLYRYQKSSIVDRAKYEYSLSKEGMIVTNEFGLAKHLLLIIKNEIESNPILKNKLFPDVRDGWDKERIICKNGAQLYVKSYGSKMRGFHPSYIVADDFLNDSVLYSEEQRKKYTSMFHSVIMNMIVPNGQVIVVGTPYHKNDLYADLKTKKGWKVFEYPAIMPDGSILWSERHNIESLLAKKDSQGSISFSREILVRPVSSDSTIFPMNLIELAYRGMSDVPMVTNRDSHPKKFSKVVMGCDLARSANVGADYSVFITIGVDELGNYWLLHMWRGKGRSYNEQMAVMKRIYSNFRHDIIMIENNQFQDIFVGMAKDANLPAIPHHTGVNKYDLKKGLPGMAVLFEQHKIKLPRGDQAAKDLTDILALELSSVTWTDKGKLEGVGEHDDCALSLWLSLRAATYVNSNFSYDFI